MTPEAKRLGIALAALGAAVVVGYHEQYHNDLPLPPEDAQTGTTKGAGSITRDTRRLDGVVPRPWAAAERPALSSGAQLPQAVSERSHLADNLHAPLQNGMEDVKVVMSIFAQYRARFRGFPVAEDNPGFVNALTGQNPARISLIPRDHPAIDGRGQLLDRWGEPFFFHLLGRDALEVRSAGPDRKLYTTDDLLSMSAPRRDGEFAVTER